MANVVILVASFTDPANAGVCNISIRYDDVSLVISRLIVENATTLPVRAGAVNRTTGKWVWVTCNAGQDRSFNVPAGYVLDRDPEDGSLTYGMTEICCQFPGQV